ncbi:MAG: glycosyltransferase [Candidatus Cloacimonetes bacterium]|nr:glycosyltransferase [Candidatus Cloacimonadota bacterium]
MKNLLVLTSRIPYPPDRGDKVRTFFFLKELGKLYNVTLLSLIEDPGELKFKDELLNYCDDVYLFHKSKKQHLIQFAKGFFNRIPFQVNYYNFPSLKKRIRDVVEEKDIEIIYTHLIRMAPMVQDLNIRKIIDYTDAISMEYERSLPHRKDLITKLFFGWEMKRTRKYEKQIINQFDQGWFISDEDIINLGLQDNHKVLRVPNPVEIYEPKSDYSSTGKIIFVGNMSIAHNIAAVEFVVNKLMPKILLKMDLEFHVLGAHPVESVKALHGKSNTIIHGFVEDIYSELRNADVFLAPMFFSAGVQNKVLEAMAVGLPVVTTENVAKSIMAESGEQLIAAKETNDFVDSVLKLMGSEDTRRALGEAGYEHVKAHFSIQCLQEILKENL